jgi:hypothetical protein
MRNSLVLLPLFVLALAAAGCGGGKQKTPPRTTYDDIQVKGMDLSKANRLYTEGNQLYLGGGVGVPEKQRRRNLKLAVKKYGAARGIYAKALKRHPDNLSLQSRVREIDVNIDGCKRMMNLNLTK